MITIKLATLFTVALVAVAIPATAQFYPPIVLDPSLTKFFDPDSAFRASGEFIRRSPDGTTDRWPVRVAMLKGMTRVEMDITQAHSEHSAQTGKVWKEYVEMMKTAGSSEAVSIFNPGKKSVFIILPRLKSYFQSPIPDDAVNHLKKRPKHEKVEVGQEDIDGRSCTKYKLTFDKQGMEDVWRTWETPAAFIWSAKDLRGYPLRIEVLNSVGETNATLVFKDFDLKQPEAQLFEAPKGFVKCDDEQALMQRIMEKWPKSK